MANALNAPKGTKDTLPNEVGRWHHVEAIARELFAQYRYSEIRTPIFELTSLFARGIGEATDIVGKEMYSFEDKKEQALSLTLRPENTAGVVRAYVEHKLYTLPSPQKFWYMGPMFRYERPQKGRQRQFTQLGVECLATEDPRYDAEAIVLAADLLARVGLTDLTVQINSVGCPDCRPAYREKLQGYLRGRAEHLCENCVDRTERNPLRVLDCKVPGCAPVIEAAPPLEGSLCEACRSQLATVTSLLASAGLAYVINPRLVRGLDYYSRTVFEITSEKLGAQSTVCAGGRYNQLVSELGGPATAAVGWALGMERLLLLMDAERGASPRLDAIVLAVGAEAETSGFLLARELRLAGLSVDLAPSGKLDKQFKQAERLGARFAVVLAEDELAKGEVTLKDLDARTQKRVARAEAASVLLGAKAQGLT